MCERCTVSILRDYRSKMLADGLLEQRRVSGAAGVGLIEKTALIGDSRSGEPDYGQWPRSAQHCDAIELAQCVFEGLSLEMRIYGWLTASPLWGGQVWRLRRRLLTEFSCWPCGLHLTEIRSLIYSFSYRDSNLTRPKIIWVGKVLRLTVGKGCPIVLSQ